MGVRLSSGAASKLLQMLFAGTAAFLVKRLARYAAGSGVAEVKTILGGFVIKMFAAPQTLLIKTVGLILSVSSGLNLGKEGPMVRIFSHLFLDSQDLCPLDHSKTLRAAVASYTRGSFQSTPPTRLARGRFCPPLQRPVCRSHSVLRLVRDAPVTTRLMCPFRRCALLVGGGELLLSAQNPLAELLLRIAGGTHDHPPQSVRNGQACALPGTDLSHILYRLLIV